MGALRVQLALASVAVALAAFAAEARAQDSAASPVGRWALADNGSVVRIGEKDGSLHWSGVLDDGAPRELSGTASDGGTWVFPLASDPDARTVGLVEVIGSLRESTTAAASAEVLSLRLASKDVLEASRRKGDATLATFRLERQPDPKPRVTLYLYPGESVRHDKDGDTTLGHIYVVGAGAHGEKYEIAAGVPPGEGAADVGGHHMGSTPAGEYVLGEKEHHYTKNWPDSTIPWGATLEKKADGFVYYSIHEGTWVQVTGPDGVFTKAQAAEWDHTSADMRSSLGTRAHHMNDTSDLYEEGKLISPWTQGDFGEWAWNLTRRGKRSPFYIHTTPEDEEAHRGGKNRDLENSHGCVHVHPKDREDMLAKGYLVAGTKVIVKPYGEKGPPAP